MSAKKKPPAKKKAPSTVHAEDCECDACVLNERDAFEKQLQALLDGSRLFTIGAQAILNPNGTIGAQPVVARKAKGQ